jgi:DNA-binding NtrC family response regulator
LRERADIAKSEPGFDAVGADSPAMRPIMALARRLAASDATILISGEHGTGKEVLARKIHAASRRAEKPFVAINAGGYSEHLVESELFGHVRGAFTDARADRAGAFEAADGGTLFLDEIGNMPLQQQAKLLRVLQTGELYRVGSSKVTKVAVRLLAATNADLGKEVAAGRFRADLLYRLNTVELRLPALRARPEDIRPLADLFLTKWSNRMDRVLALSPDAHERLLAYAWPGNVRELEHVIERAAVLAQRDVIDAPLFGLDGGAPPALLPEAMTLEQAERYLIDRALERASVSAGARSTGAFNASPRGDLENTAPARFRGTPGADLPAGGFAGHCARGDVRRRRWVTHRMGSAGTSGGNCACDWPGRPAVGEPRSPYHRQSHLRHPRRRLRSPWEESSRP